MRSRGVKGFRPPPGGVSVYESTGEADLEGSQTVTRALAFTVQALPDPTAGDQWLAIKSSDDGFGDPLIFNGWMYRYESQNDEMQFMFFDDDENEVVAAHAVPPVGSRLVWIVAFDGTTLDSRLLGESVSTAAAVTLGTNAGALGLGNGADQRQPAFDFSVHCFGGTDSIALDLETVHDEIVDLLRQGRSDTAPSSFENWWHGDDMDLFSFASVIGGVALAPTVIDERMFYEAKF